MRSTGLSAFIALWKTMEISRQRSLRSSAGVQFEQVDALRRDSASAVDDAAARHDRRWPQQAAQSQRQRRLARAALAGKPNVSPRASSMST